MLGSIKNGGIGTYNEHICCVYMFIQVYSSLLHKLFCKENQQFELVPQAKKKSTCFGHLIFENEAEKDKAALRLVEEG